MKQEISPKLEFLDGNLHYITLHLPCITLIFCEWRLSDVARSSFIVAIKGELFFPSSLMHCVGSPLLSTFEKTGLKDL